MTRLLLPACFILAIVQAGCSSSTTTGEKLYDLKGMVVAVNPDEKKIEINHQDIPGLMPAMKMPFDYENPKVIEGLSAGDSVEGKIKVVDGKYIITQLRKTASGSADVSKAKVDAEAEIKASLAKLSEVDRKLAEAQNLCPIADERLGSMDVPVKIALKGETIFLCCKSCVKPAEKDPDGTLKKLAELKKK